MRNINLLKRIRFYVNSMLGSGSNGLLVWLAVVSFTFVLFVTCLTWAVGISEHESFGALLWDLTMRAVTPWEIEASMGSLTYLLVLLVITLFGIFVLSILISFLSAIIDARIREISQGLQPFPFDGHILILGWSSRIPAIIEELVLANESQKSALVVIASNLEFDELESNLKRLIGSTSGTKLFIRSRKIDSRETFENLNVAGARRVIVLGDETGGRVQLERLKTTIALYNYFDNLKTQPPGIMIEADDDEEAGCITLGSRNRAIPVVVSDLPARLIVETVFQSNLPAVYEELLSFEGNEIYITDQVTVFGLAEVTFWDALQRFGSCVPIGIVRATDNAVMINPSPELVLGTGDRLVIVAEDDSLIRADEQPTEVNPIDTEVGSAETDGGKLAVGLIGVSMSTGPIITRLLDTDLCSVSILCDTQAEYYPCIADLAARDDVVLIDGKATDADQFLRDGQLKADVLIVSNYSFSDPENSDLDIIQTILKINTVPDVTASHHIIAELNSGDSRDMMADLVDLDFVVSDKIGSKIFAQFVENPHLIEVIDSLVCSGNHRVTIKPLSVVDKNVTEVVFGSVRRSRQSDGILIGLRYLDGGLNVLKLNPGDSYTVPAGAKSLEGVFVE